METHSRSDANSSHISLKGAGSENIPQSLEAPQAAVGDCRTFARTIQRVKNMLDNAPEAKQLKKKAELMAASPSTIRTQSKRQIGNSSSHVRTLEQRLKQLSSAKMISGAPNAAPERAVAQMVVDPELGNDEPNSFLNIYNSPTHLQRQTYLDVWGWIAKSRQANELLIDAEAVVEDDAEETLLEEIESAIDLEVTACNGHVVDFNNTQNISVRQEIMSKVRECQVNINHEFNTLKFYFKPIGHGFGAKGRATEVPHRRVVEGARREREEEENENENANPDQFIQNTELNGTRMTNKYYVTGGRNHAHYAGTITVKVANTIIHPPRELEDEHEETISTRLGGLDPPQGQTKLTNENFVAIIRADTQEGAMGSTNARGYAWFYEVDGWDTTQWEWLHIRAAGLSGHTNSRNLVLGTRDANTQMMPYESNMRALENAVSNSPYYSGVTATWTPQDKEEGDGNHLYLSIVMTWNVPRTALGVRENAPPVSGRVVIHPLSVGEVLSKAEVQCIEDELKTIRDGIPPPDMDEEEDE